MEWLLPSLRGWSQTSRLVSKGIRGSPEGANGLLVRLVDDYQIPPRIPDGRPDLRILLEGVDRYDRAVELIEHVEMRRNPVSHPAYRLAIEPAERDREPRPEFLLELSQHRPRRDDEYPAGPTSQGEFRSDQTRLERLSESNVVGDQKPDAILRQCALGRRWNGRTSIAALPKARGFREVVGAFRNAASRCSFVSIRPEEMSGTSSTFFGSITCRSLSRSQTKRASLPRAMPDKQRQRTSRYPPPNSGFAAPSRSRSAPKPLK